MRSVPHEGDVGRRLLAEYIRLQQQVARKPLPPPEERSRPLRHVLLAVVAGLVLVALSLVILPPGRIA